MLHPNVRTYLSGGERCQSGVGGERKGVRGGIIRMTGKVSWYVREVCQADDRGSARWFVRNVTEVLTGVRGVPYASEGRYTN